jgi:hypothetical protein
MVAEIESNVIICMQRPIITNLLKALTAASILELETANTYKIRQQIEAFNVVISRLI